MKRRILGSRFSMASCFSPAVAFSVALLVLAPRSFFSRLMIGPCAPPMLKRPSRVSLITSPADMKHTMASQFSRRA